MEQVSNKHCDLHMFNIGVDQIRVKYKDFKAKLYLALENDMVQQILVVFTFGHHKYYRSKAINSNIHF